MRKLYILLLALFVFILTSCKKYEIPEGPIKDFVYQLDFEKAFEHVNTGKSVITASLYVNDVLDGQVQITTYIDKTNHYYQYMNTDVSGSYVGTGNGQYNYHNQQILTYMTDQEEVKVFKMTDSAEEEINYREEELIQSVNNFFYQKLESGYHSDGVYYGDYIIANCGKFYSLFSLDSAKKELTYEVNTSNYNSLNQEIVSMHHFVVDEYGMIIDLTSKSINIETNTVIETTIECEYNMDIEKLEALT